MTHYEILNARKARRIAFLASAMLVSCAVAGPAIADVPPASAIQNSDSVEKLLAEGQKAVKAGNLRAALISYKNAVSAAPRNGNARMQLGTLLMRMGDPAGAERELRQARKDGVPEGRTADSARPKPAGLWCATGRSRAREGYGS